MEEALKKRNFESEFYFSSSRSSGPGGQNVNKVNTKIELRFNIATSSLLNEEEKEVIIKKLENKITKEGEIIITSQTERTQFDNRNKAIEKFYKLIANTLKKQKKRKNTEPTFSSKIKRLENKRMKSRKKTLRKASFEE